MLLCKQFLLVLHHSLGNQTSCTYCSLMWKLLQQWPFINIWSLTFKSKLISIVVVVVSAVVVVVCPRSITLKFCPNLVSNSGDIVVVFVCFLLLLLLLLLLFMMLLLIEKRNFKVSAKLGHQELRYCCYYFFCCCYFCNCWCWWWCCFCCLCWSQKPAFKGCS